MTGLWVIAFLQAAAAADTVLPRVELEAITVTATRSREALLNVPAAVRVVELSDGVAIRGYGLEEVLSGIPGVWVGTRSGNHDIRLVIRGFGARGAGERSNAGTSRGVRILLNGFPETEPDGRTAFDFIDLIGAQAVEVIRSNASALWGNASGGLVAVDIVPPMGTNRLILQAQTGSYGFRRLAGYGGAAIGSAQYYLQAGLIDWPGWREHSESHRWLVHTGLIGYIGRGSRLGVHLSGTRNRFRIPGPLSWEEFHTEPQKAFPVYLQRQERRDNKLFRIGSSLEHQSGPHRIEASAFATTKVLQRSERNTFRDFNRYYLGGSLLYRFEHELGSARRSRWQLGGDAAYQDGAILFYSLVNGQRGTQLRTNKREGAGNFGLFAQHELDLLPGVQLSWGARYDWIPYYGEDFLSARRDRRIYRQMSPKFSLLWRYDRLGSIYANMGGGLEVPAGNEVDPPPELASQYLLNPNLRPMRSTSYEVGTRQGFLPQSGLLRWVSYEATGYWIEVRDELVPFNNGAFFTGTAASRRIGLELQAALEAHLGLRLEGSLTLGRYRYTRYELDPRYGRFTNLAPGDYRGNRIAGVPERYFFAKAEYRLGRTVPISASLLLRGFASYWADDGNRWRVPGTAVWDARLRLGPMRVGHPWMALEGFVAVTNLANTRYAASVFVNPDIVNGRPVYLEPGLPRQFTLGLSMRLEP
ncbi:MAG: TonB-dependent receptor [Bacteroidetes bacterium]|nr:TonB-dependent receptor [Rhodothermia bacterium]MCX7907091.1 TonB-dependent receptor [Bacteroidota bacterium]MDW8137545.1 TonB-dependent receptor [Bacteroidota bacterium]MDW8285501.1 TonB-dependent receptor [Bacteroidota bacterium]